MIILDTIQADQIEVGDQIIVDGDPIEVSVVDGDPHDEWAVVIEGFSHETGDKVLYPLPFDYFVDTWAV